MKLPKINVMIEKQDLEKIAVESTSTINIKEFIDERELFVN
jgi:non-homologous end joining protein Ku